MPEPVTAFLLGYLIPTAIDGFIANAADRGACLAWGSGIKQLADYIKQPGLDINHDLEQAVLRCFWRAQQTVAEKCLEELPAGQGRYTDVPEELVWLNRTVREMKARLEKPDKRPAEPPLSSLAELGTLVSPSGEIDQGQLEANRNRLVTAATSDLKTPQRFKEKAAQLLPSLVSFYFAYEIVNNKAVGSIFTVQLLERVNAQIQGQTFSLAGLAQNLEAVKGDQAQILKILLEIRSNLQPPEPRPTDDGPPHNLPLGMSKFVERETGFQLLDV